MVNSYLSQPNYVELAKANGETAQLLKVKSFLVDHKPLGFDACIVWAREMFQTEFENEIKQLLFSLPKDMVRLFPCWTTLTPCRLRVRERRSGRVPSEHRTPSRSTVPT